MGEIAQQIEELKLCALDCRICDLSKTRTNVVFGEGNPETPLVIIGEGPGQNEDATGRPFVGRAGALLDQALLENNLTRKHVYIMNVVKCRACIIENGRTRNRPPSPAEIGACSTWLEKQLAIIKPMVILCLGAPSAKSIIHRDFRMTQERGQFFESKYAPHAIAALHPAYVLRQDGQTHQVTRQQLVADIGAARRKVVEVKKAAKLASEQPDTQA
jgi:uracil-DNA glycosylase